MHIRSICTLALLCALVAPFSADRALAQSQSADKPAQYTYVSEWAVPRAMWGDYLKGEAADIDLMKKGVADGVITGFGTFAVLTHQEGEPTHGTWFNATSIANILKFLETLRNAPGSTDAPLAASKHWDYILESHDYAGHSGTFNNGILRIGRWTPAPGAVDPGGKILKATMVSVLDKLLADGALHAYTIDTEAVHTAPVGTLFVVLVANGGEGIDKFEAAVDAAEKSNPAAWAGLTNTLDVKAHSDTLARVGVYTHK